MEYTALAVAMIYAIGRLKDKRACRSNSVLYITVVI